METTVIYPGTFDPITFGHVDLINRALTIFDRVIVAVADATHKSTLFSQEQRVRIAQTVFKDNPKINIQPFSGLIVDFMQEHQVKTLLRGIRTISDMEHEFQLATMNRMLYPAMETLFLAPDPRFANISSTIVREIAKMKGNLQPFIPQEVINAFKK